MATEPTSPPGITTFPPAPNSATDTPAVFDTKANNFVSAQVSYVPEANNLSSWIESTATEVFNNANEAFDSASDAATSEANAAQFAEIAQNAANFLGAWSGLTGSASLGDIVTHENTRWQAAVAIPDITASEPSATNSDWLVITADKWTTLVTASGTTAPNSYELCAALGGDITRTMPVLDGGNFIVISNAPEPISDSYVILPISGVTVYGNKGSLVDGDNLKLRPGEVVHIAADSTTIYRIV